MNSLVIINELINSYRAELRYRKHSALDHDEYRKLNRVGLK